MINSRQKWLALGHINMVPASPLWRPPSQLSSTSLRREAALASTPQRTSSWSFAALWKSEALKSLYKHPCNMCICNHTCLITKQSMVQWKMVHLDPFPELTEMVFVLTGLRQQDPQHFSLTRATCHQRWRANPAKVLIEMGQSPNYKTSGLSTASLVSKG